MAGATAGAYVPPTHSAVPRQAQPGQAFRHEPITGPVVEVVADANGVCWPRTPEEVRLLDLHLLPAVPDAQPIGDGPTFEALLHEGELVVPVTQTVATLTARLRELGVDVPKGARKAELEALVAEAASTTTETDDADGDDADGQED